MHIKKKIDRYCLITFQKKEKWIYFSNEIASFPTYILTWYIIKQSVFANFIVTKLYFFE